MQTAVHAEQAWCVMVPHRANGVRVARRRLAASLAGTMSQERLADALAVVAELVGNAIRHACGLPGGVVRVAWRLLATGGLRIVVTDGGPQRGSSTPRVKPPSIDSVDGRGLAIVAALSNDWGVELTEARHRNGVDQSVWAELP